MGVFNWSPDLNYETLAGNAAGLYVWNTAGKKFAHALIDTNINCELRLAEGWIEGFYGRVMIKNTGSKTLTLNPAIWHSLTAATSPITLNADPLKKDILHIFAWQGYLFFFHQQEGVNTAAIGPWKDSHYINVGGGGVGAGWNATGCFLSWPGKAAIGNQEPTDYQALAYEIAGGSGMRIFDITNGLVIAQYTGGLAAVPTIYSLSIINPPSLTPAVWNIEVQGALGSAIQVIDLVEIYG